MSSTEVLSSSNPLSPAIHPNDAPPGISRDSTLFPDNEVQKSSFRAYEIVRPHSRGSDYLEIQLDGQTLYWSHTHNKPLAGPKVDLHVDAENGPIVASSQLDSMKRNSRILHGNREEWTVVACESFISASSFAFDLGSKSYRWKRTNDKSLGATRLENRSFKLLDIATGDVLATFVHVEGALGTAQRSARIEYLIDLGVDLEIVSLVTILGIDRGE